MVGRTNPRYRFPNIVRWMMQHNISQAEFARQMGMRDSTVSNIIMGRTEPRLYTIKSVLEVTGMPFEKAFREAKGWKG